MAMMYFAIPKMGTKAQQLWASFLCTCYLLDLDLLGFLNLTNHCTLKYFIQQLKTKKLFLPENLFAIA
jgi:hypothetical protein